ncbi:hypothetical protein Pth03_16660 [Planotetraspora thailandica]|uniref:Acyltransferase 3 domain-containing protein n=1 Tax=Planotetraspora thailandica TaxID=487172 RepID=A0A8J3V0H5_9ACTN|nr:acyltransferase family protein [Planotetraspora thailandica]GII53277.1 hypothetical protein Pth03_16660 [Planotetraspora thailandica]
MSDSRHHSSVPPSRSGAAPDAEDEPTGVISRITGEWPPPGGDKPDSAPEGRRKAGAASAKTPAKTPVDRPPLPVRQPRRRGAAAANGAAPDAATPSQGFDYFASRTSPPPGAQQVGGSPGTSEAWDTPSGVGARPFARASSTGAPSREAEGPQWPEIVDDAPAAPSWDPWRRGGQEAPAASTASDLAEPAILPAWSQAPAAALTGTGPVSPETVQRARQALPAGWDALERDPDTEPEPEPEPQATKKRDPFLDNVKFVLITLVVIGHSLIPTLAAHSSKTAYLFIYVFHMPLFIIVSGYLSRNFWNSNAKTNKLVDTFLVPYVIVEIGYAALRTALGAKWSLTITDPAWINWYLPALLLWRLSTPVWNRMRFPLVVAVLIYLAAGMSDLPSDFSINRFFGFLPFFVLGLVIKPGLFTFLGRPWVRVLSVLVLAGAAAAAIYLVKTDSVTMGPFYYKESYKALHLIWWEGMAQRMAVLVAALAMCAAVLSLVPRSETWFTDLGTRTLYCYLLHGVPVLIATEMGWLSVPWLFGPLGVAALASASFALAIVVSMPFTRTLFKWLLEPRLTWLYRRPRQESA